MKLLYLLATDGAWGGLEKHAFDVAGAMAQRGHEVSVLCAASYADRCPFGVKIEPFDWRASRNNPLLWLRLRRALQRLAPDLIHAQADKPVYVLGRCGWPVNARAIGTVHNVKSRYGAFAKLDAVIAVSRAIAAAVPNPDVHVVYNGVQPATPDPDALQRIRQWRQQHTGPLLLAIGRLVPAKGFDLLLKAWPAHASATLVILGEGKQRPELEQLIRERQLQNVSLMGNSTEVSAWMASADLLVISSRNEGGPYTLAEALVAGLPVISTNVGMVPDFLPADWIAPANDEAALNQLLEKTLAQLPQLREQSQPAIAKARQHLTTKAMMDATEAVYRKLLQQRSSTNPR